MIRILLFCEIVGYALCLKCANDLKGPAADAGGGVDCEIRIASCTLGGIALSAVPAHNLSSNSMSCSYDKSVDSASCHCNYDGCSTNFKDIEKSLVQQNVPRNSAIMTCLAGLMAGTLPTSPASAPNQNSMAPGTLISTAPPTPTAMPGPAPSTEGDTTTKDGGAQNPPAPAVAAPAPATAASANTGGSDTTIAIFAVFGSIVLILVLVPVTMLIIKYLDKKGKEKYRKKHKHGRKRTES